MGGDFAPEVVVHGALLALKEVIAILFCRDKAAVNPCLADEICMERLTVYHCNETVDMGESL
jgi:fatty acid/phospholipid biosynthesis enzyme